MITELFEAMNPWRSGHLPAAPAIRRTLLDALVSDLDRPEVTLLLGPRAAGKTTLGRHLVREALESGRFAPREVFWFDLDTMDCQDVLADNRSLLEFLGPRAARSLVVIDEAQRLPQPGRFLKSVHDLGLPLKLLVTGSSSLEIRSGIRESLAGRRLTRLLTSLTPLEWERHFASPAAAPGSDYLRFGGFPQVALEVEAGRRMELLAELLAAYMDRDIEAFLRLERLDAFHSLLQILARQVGGLVNGNEIASTLGIGRATVGRYLRILEETFVVRAVPPFHRKLRSELTKMPKVFFLDLGLRNLLAGELFRPEPADRGAIAESFVFAVLLALCPDRSIRYWRTEAKAEVDFVVETAAGLLPVEVKARSMRRPSLPSGMRSFLAGYACPVALVLVEDLEASVEHAGARVEFVPRSAWVERLAVATAAT